MWGDAMRALSRALRRLARRIEARYGPDHDPY